jgi:hypothetical protein
MFQAPHMESSEVMELQPATLTPVGMSPGTVPRTRSLLSIYELNRSGRGDHFFQKASNAKSLGEPSLNVRKPVNAKCYRTLSVCPLCKRALTTKSSLRAQPD